MAVQKSKVTRSRRGQRRSHDALTAKQFHKIQSQVKCTYVIT